MRKLVLALAAALALSTMAAGLTSAAPAKPVATAEFTVCTRTADAGGQTVDAFAFTVSWTVMKNPYKVELYGGPSSDFAAAAYLDTIQIGHHPSPFTWLGLQANYNDAYLFAFVQNRKDQGPSDSFQLSTAGPCEPS